MNFCTRHWCASCVVFFLTLSDVTHVGLIEMSQKVTIERVCKYLWEVEEIGHSPKACLCVDETRIRVLRFH